MPTMSARASGCAWWTSWTESAIRPLFLAGSPPPPGGSARVPRAAHGPHAAVYALDVENMPDNQAGTAEQELLAAERHAALREAFTHLPPEGQQLIALLIADPPVPYAQISARLGIPVGSIGPTR